MYEDVLKEKENLGVKLAQGEEEKKKLFRENELLGRKVSENAKVKHFVSLISVWILVDIPNFVNLTFHLKSALVMTLHTVDHKTYQMYSQFSCKWPALVHDKVVAYGRWLSAGKKQQKELTLNWLTLFLIT